MYCGMWCRAVTGKVPIHIHDPGGVSHPVFSSRDFLTLPLRLPTIPPPDRLACLLACLCVRASFLLLLVSCTVWLFFWLRLSFPRCPRTCPSRACKHNLGSICRPVPSLPCPVRPLATSPLRLVSCAWLLLARAKASVVRLILLSRVFSLPWATTRTDQRTIIPGTHTHGRCHCHCHQT